MEKIIEIQEQLRPALPRVIGCKDYREQEELLKRVDQILKRSGVEAKFVRLSLEKFQNRSKKQASQKDLIRWSQHSERALRCTILKNLLKEDYRGMSISLAQSTLFRWFCRIPELEMTRVPGKSTLQEYGQWLPLEEMEKILKQLREALSNQEKALEIGLENELEMEAAWIDSTCLKANIHFPVDWVLLPDAVRTLVKAILVIRKHGLKIRMPEPETFLAAINGQTMAMSAALRSKTESKKARKKALRSMKKICRTIQEHGKNYRSALEKRWKETDLTYKEAQVILRRIDNILRQLPAAIKQAHERIIAERQLANADKILSLYESELHVIVRGKAAAKVEFGNTLFIAETSSGFILHHQLCKENSPGDARWLEQNYQTLKTASSGKLCAVVGDRGFESAQTCKKLQENEAFNGLCPRDVGQMKKRLRNDEIFVAAQKRRAQTEGRIAILKNCFLNETPRAKGFQNRQLQVAWAVFTHNLWLVARCPWAEESKKLLAA